MALDPAVNFGKVVALTGYDAAATTIALVAGHGARLPDPSVSGPYNLVWFNSTDYSDPADDPNREIIRVTGPAGTGDTKTILRAQEGTVASAKNTAGKTYELFNGPTALTMSQVTAELALKADASALASYLTIASAAATYLTIAAAASTYLTIATAASTYLSIANAATTYLAIADAATTYVPYTGATANVDLGSNTLAASGISVNSHTLDGSGLNTSGVLVMYGGIGFQLQTSSGNLLGGSSGVLVAEAPLTIDVTSATALVVRADGASGNALTVDTSSIQTTVNKILQVGDGALQAQLKFADHQTANKVTYQVAKLNGGSWTATIPDLGASGTFVFGSAGTGANEVAYWSATNVLTSSKFMTYSSGTLTLGGNGQSGNLILYSEQGATDRTVTFKPSGSMTSSFSFTFPTALPGSTQFLTISNSGAWGYDASTYVPTSRTVSTTSPLAGGGALSGNLTLSIANAAADGSTKGAAAFLAADFNDNGSGLISLDMAGAHVWTAKQTMTGGASAAGLNVASVAAPSSPAEGDVWLDSTQKALQTYLNGVKQTQETCLFTSTASATQAGSTSELTIIGSGIGTLTIPANFLVAGKTIRITARGLYTTPASVLSTTVFKFKLGSTAVITSPTTAMNAGATNGMIGLVAEFTCRTTGASGTVRGHGQIYYQNLATVGIPRIEQFISTSDVTIDTTASLALDLTAQFAGTISTESITIDNVIIEVLN